VELHLKEIQDSRSPFNRYNLHQKLRHPAYQSEPKGSVGSAWRTLFIKRYMRVLLHHVSKMLVILLFLANVGVSIYGLQSLKQGHEMVDLSPDGLYLKTYDALTLQYLNTVDLPVEIFFLVEQGQEVPWHEKRVVKSIEEFVNR